MQVLVYDVVSNTQMIGKHHIPRSPITTTPLISAWIQAVRSNRQTPVSPLFTISLPKSKPTGHGLAGCNVTASSVLTISGPLQAATRCLWCVCCQCQRECPERAIRKAATQQLQRAKLCKEAALIPKWLPRGGRTLQSTAATVPDPEVPKHGCEDHGASVRQMQHCPEQRDAVFTVWHGGARPLTIYENCEWFHPFAYVQQNFHWSTYWTHPLLRK
jgi:hypothetical protein